MAAASIEGITIKIGCDVSDLKDEMSGATDAIAGVGDAAKNEITAAAAPVENLKKKFADTAVSAERVGKAAMQILHTVGHFTTDSISKAFKLDEQAAEDWKTLKGAFDSFKTAFGEAFLPELEKVMPIITKTLNDAATFLREHPAIAESVAALTVAIIVLSAALSFAAPIAIAFGVSIGAILGPVALVILIIIALGAAIYLVVTHWSEITAWFQETWESVKTAVTTAIDTMKTKFDEFRTKVNTAKANLISFKESVVTKFENIKTEIIDALKSIDLIQAGRDFVTSIGNGIKEGIESIRTTVQGWFLSLIPDGLENLFNGGGGGNGGTGGTGGNASDPMGVLPKRAGGGPVTAGSPYIIGEAGPELFVPRTNGYVVPNDQLQDMQPINVNIGNVYGESYLRDYVISAVTGAIRQEVRLGA